MIAAIAALAVGVGAPAVQHGIGAGSQGRRRPALYRRRRRTCAANGPRHGAISQAQCRPGETLHHQAHQARLQGAERRRSQGRGPGTAHPGQSRCACRLGLFARCHRVGAARHRRQKARGDHECRHRVHHQPVAGFRAHVVQHVACRLRLGRGGRQDAACQDRGRGLYRLSARQGQPRRLQERASRPMAAR